MLVVKWRDSEHIRLQRGYTVTLELQCPRRPCHSTPSVWICHETLQCHSHLLLHVLIIPDLAAIVRSAVAVASCFMLVHALVTAAVLNELCSIMLMKCGVGSSLSCIHSTPT